MEQGEQRGHPWGQREAETYGEWNSQKDWRERVGQGEIGVKSSPESVGAGKGREERGESKGGDGETQEKQRRESGKRET